MEQIKRKVGRPKTKKPEEPKEPKKRGQPIKYHTEEEKKQARKNYIIKFYKKKPKETKFCDCGGKYSLTNHNHHTKTKRHILFTQQRPEEIITECLF